MLKAMKIEPVSCLNAMAFSPNLVLCACCSDHSASNRILGVWEIGKLDNTTVLLRSAAVEEMVLKSFIGPSDGTHAVAFSPSGEILACGASSEINLICLWDISTRKPLSEPLSGHTARIKAIAWSPTGALLASGSEDKTVRVWSVDSGKLLFQPLYGHSGAICALAFNSSSALLSSGSKDCLVKIWSAENGMLLKTLAGHAQPILALSWNPAGTVVASGSEDHTIRLWSAETGLAIKQPLVGHSDSVTSLAWSPQGDCIASGSNDSKVWLWSASTGLASVGPLSLHISQMSVQISSLTGHRAKVLGVSYDHGGNMLISSDEQGLTIVWDIIRTDLRLALAMGGHRRLGQHSFLLQLQEDTLEYIANLMISEASYKKYRDTRGSPWLDSPYAVACR